MTLDQKIERLWTRTIKIWCEHLQSDCWQWTGPKRNRDGYGQAPGSDGICGERSAHRAAFVVTNGPIPAGTELDHLCGNRACINPSHLEPVAHVANVRRGGRCKLSMQIASEIRSADGSYSEIAKRFGTNKYRVYAIKTGKIWKVA